MAKQKFAAVGAPVATGDDLYLTTDAISITPTLGAELLANGGFSAWTGDNPDGWTVSGESGSDPEVTERDPGQAHADTKTTGGAANLYSSVTNLQPRLYQNVLSIGSFYLLSVDISARLAGGVSTDDGVVLKSFTATGNHQMTLRAATTRCFVRSGSPAPINLTIDASSAKLLSTLWQLFTHAVAYGDFSVDLTIPVASFQGGVVFNAQDASNYALLYYDRLDGKVYLIKVVAGVTTVLGSWSATYSAGKTLTARRHQDGTLDVIYNGVTLASGIAATGLTGQRAGPFLTDASGVTISRYAWDARSIT